MRPKLDPFTRIIDRTWKDFVHEHRQRQQEMFVPLRHDPGRAHADWDCQEFRVRAAG